MDAHENPMQWIVAKCWEDGAFKERLLADPAAVLKDEDIEIPEGVTINVVEDTAQVRTLVIPAPAGRMEDAALDAIAAAGGGVSACTGDCWLSGMGNLW